MKARISDIGFTPAVKAAQEKRGSRSAYSKMEQRGGWTDVVTPELAEFIARRDSFYLGTATVEGQALHPAPRRSQRVPQGIGRTHTGNG